MKISKFIMPLIFLMVLTTSDYAETTVTPEVAFSSQLIGIISINIFVFVVSFIIWFVMKQTIGIRLSAKAEKLGTDKSEVGVVAYAIRD